MQKQRNSTIEYLRILSMLGVCGLHYMNREIGGVLNTTLPVNIIISHFLESLCITSVNVFVLISAYFMTEQKTTGLRKAIDLYLTMAVYHLMFFAVAVAVEEYPFSLKNLIIAVCPFVVGNKWFLETYILFLLFIPFLNTLTRNMNRKTHLFFSVLWLLVFSVWSSFFPSPPLTDKGYGITNFVTLYLIASYIRKYVEFLGKRSICIKGSLIFFFSVVLITISSFTILKGRAWGYCYLFNITASVAIFIVFLNLPKTYTRIINIVAGLTFGVYISHANVYFQNVIYHDLMHTERYMDSVWMPVHFLLCIILQFSGCAVLEWIRQIIWKPTIGKWIRQSKLLKRENDWEETVFSGEEPEIHA